MPGLTISPQSVPPWLLMSDCVFKDSVLFHFFSPQSVQSFYFASCFDLRHVKQHQWFLELSN